MKDSNLVRHMFNMTKSQKKESEDANKNQISEEHNGGKFEKDPEGNNIQKDNNTTSGSKLPISGEKDENYNCLKQGIPKNTKFRSIVDTYKHTERLSSPKEEYNWRHPSSLENQKSEVQNEHKKGKDQVNAIEEILPSKQEQKIIHGEFESHGEHSQEDNSNHNTLVKDNIDNKGISESTLFKSLFDLCEVIIQHETSEEQDRSITRKDHEEQQQQQQQQPNNITGEPKLNKVITGEDSLPNINLDHVVNENDANCGSKLWIRDGNDGKYRIMQGIPRSIKFRSISNLYECTTRLSPVEEEYNSRLSRSEDSNIYHLKKED